MKYRINIKCRVGNSEVKFSISFILKKNGGIIFYGLRVLQHEPSIAHIETQLIIPIAGVVRDINNSVALTWVGLEQTKNYILIAALHTLMLFTHSATKSAMMNVFEVQPSRRTLLFLCYCLRMNSEENKSLKDYIGGRHGN